jgi:glycosyltransferase involved in cell wall biosynthesis
MDVTVAICTWNRADLLQKTLEAMTFLAVPSDCQWELIVVNNACTDATNEVLEAFTDRLPLRPVFEARQGHSNARNRAIAEAKGDLVIWTDDDVLVDSHWLVEYLRAFRANRHIAYFGGPIEPWFESYPPRWFQRHLHELSGVVVCVDHGREMRPLERGETLFGANLAVRRDVSVRFPFNAQLGRMKDALTGGDDTDFLGRLADEGLEGLWVPLAKVKHFVPRSRTNAGYVNRWYRDAGRTAVRRYAPMDGPRFRGVPRWIWRKYVTQLALASFWRPTRNARWFESHREALMLRGIIEETRAARSIERSTASGDAPAR